MILAQLPDFVNQIPVSILFAGMAFIGSWGVAKYKMSELEKIVAKLELKLERIEKDFQAFKDKSAVDNERIRIEFIAETHRFELDTIKAMHGLEKKLTEIHSIVTERKQDS